jgi:hypothetical protein
VWNKLSQGERDAIIELALEKPELSPRELAVSYTDRGQFVSESSVYRLLKAQDLITSGLYPDAGFGQVPTAHPSY